MRLSLTAGGEHDGLRLIDFLAARLPGAAGATLSRAAIRRLIVAGAARVDGRSARPGQPVRPGSRIDVRLPGRARRGPGPPAALASGAVLYEDDALIAVDKPPGLPTHATADPSRPHLVGLLQDLIASRAGLDPRAVYLGVHQRLDRDTSGVVLFARSPAANAGLAAAFEGREVEKVYLALTARPPRLPPAAWAVALAIEPGRERVRTGRGGQPARTEFRRLEAHPRGLLIQARPRTGRKHQVRVHLAACGAPILGDRTYAPPGVARAAPRVMLHAARLVLAHPVTGRPLRIEAPPPPDFVAARAGLRRAR